MGWWHAFADRYVAGHERMLGQPLGPLHGVPHNLGVAPSTRALELEPCFHHDALRGQIVWNSYANDLFEVQLLERVMDAGERTFRG